MPELAVVGKICWECAHEFTEGEQWWYYYHGDQDDRVCEHCARKLKQGETIIRGMSVFKTG